MSVKHLWEVDHPYYCNDSNYYSNDSLAQFKRWSDFLDEFGDADMDYNLLFRFDWKEDEDTPFNGDVNYRNGTLCIYWMGQRKSNFFISHVEVCRADEPAVIEFLKPRWEYMRALWIPLPSPPTDGEG